jgi:hypothetical protein
VTTDPAGLPVLVVGTSPGVNIAHLGLHGSSGSGASSDALGF